MSGGGGGASSFSDVTSVSLEIPKIMLQKS